MSGQPANLQAYAQTMRGLEGPSPSWTQTMEQKRVIESAFKRIGIDCDAVIGDANELTRLEFKRGTERLTVSPTESVPNDTALTVVRTQEVSELLTLVGRARNAQEGG